MAANEKVLLRVDVEPLVRGLQALAKVVSDVADRLSNLGENENENQTEDDHQDG